MTIRPILLTAALALVLASCNDADEPAAQPARNDTNEAMGEVLGGSISDEMIPLDTLTSQAPAKSSVANNGGDGDDEAKSPDGASPDGGEQDAEQGQ